ncbi:MAG: RHS repeat-associated core domain-containing protein, partial [Planctomycetes bacterium]|nr:RHS repeat-associated core domain-containing protein [Planctomycetota bacterium]
QGSATEYANTRYYYSDGGNRAIHYTESLVDSATSTYLTSKSYYDEGGRLEKTVVDAVGGGLNETTYFEYDKLSRLTLRHDAYTSGLEMITDNVYDNAGRLTDTYRYPNGGSRGDYHTMYTHNDRGQTLEVYDANGIYANPDYWITKNTYYVDGKLKKTENAEGGETSYTYNNDGTTATMTYKRDASNSGTTTYAYLDNGWLETTTYPDSTVVTLGYDANGNLTSRQDQNGHEITFGFDDNNRLTSKVVSVTDTVTYTLDANGNPLTVDDPTTDIDNTYDYLNRLTQVVDNKLSKTITYAYYEDGTRKEMNGPETGDSDKVQYAYDKAKRLYTVKYGTTPTTEETNTYNALGQITQKTLGNSSSVTYTYNTTTRWLTGVYNNNTSSSTLISSFVYTHDLVGNRISMALNGGDSVSFGFDKTYQLTNETRTGSITYTNIFVYDKAGNRKQQGRTNSAGTVTYYSDYNDANQLISDTVNATTNIYSYNNNGDMIGKTDGTNTWAWAYSYEDMIVSYYDSISGNTGSYVTDAMGRRISKTANGVTEKFIHDGHNVIADYDGSNTLLAKYVTPGLDNNLLVITGGNTYYYMHDGLGSVVNLVSSVQSVANSYDYNAFGEMLASTETVINRYKYTGRELDSETGTYHYRPRQYHQMLGRFNRRDPIGYDDGINIYTYVHNNPVNHRDPLGLGGGNVVSGTGDQEKPTGTDEKLNCCEGCKMEGTVLIEPVRTDGYKIIVKMSQTPVFESKYVSGYKGDKRGNECCKWSIKWWDCYSKAPSEKAEEYKEHTFNINPLYSSPTIADPRRHTVFREPNSSPDPVNIETTKGSWVCSNKRGKWTCYNNRPKSNALLYYPIEYGFGRTPYNTPVIGTLTGWQYSFGNPPGVGNELTGQEKNTTLSDEGIQ